MEKKKNYQSSKKIKIGFNKKVIKKQNLKSKDRLYFNTKSLWNKNQLNIKLNIKLLNSSNKDNDNILEKKVIKKEILNKSKDSWKHSKKVNIFLKSKIEKSISNKKSLKNSQFKSIRNNYFLTPNNSVTNEISKIKFMKKSQSKKKEIKSIKKKEIEKSINTKDTKVNNKENDKKIRNKHDFNHMHKIMNFLYKDKYLLDKRNKIRNNLKIFKGIIDKENKDSSYDMIENYIKMESSTTDSINNYELIQNIGHGAYSIVKLSVNKNNNIKYALKYYEKNHLLNIDKFLNLKNEIICLRKLNDKRIIKLFSILSSKTHIILVLEYISTSTLFDYLQVNKNNKNEDYKNNLKIIFKNVCKAIKFMHKNDFIHGDLKPENIIIYKKNKIKLIDFGFSKIVFNNKLISNYCGTPQFIAPEIILKKPYEGFPIDIWAWGIILYKITNDRYPFTGPSNKDIFQKILNWDHKNLFKKKDYENNNIEILNKILVKNPNNRLTIKQLLNKIKKF